MTPSNRTPLPLPAARSRNRGATSAIPPLTTTRYTGGWNLRAVAAFGLGGVLAVGGSYSTVVKGINQGPFPVDGVIPFLKPLADYGWAVGLASAVLLSLGTGRNQDA